MKNGKKALVVGGSLGGLCVANLLLRAGWDVHVYERVADELLGRGAGIVTHPQLMEVLHQAGVSIGDDLGVAVARRITLDRDGSVLASRAQPQLLTAWGRLYQVLRSAFPDARYHNGKQLSHFSQNAHSVTACFSDGACIDADLLIAADGLRSTVRQMLQPDVKPAYAGYIAWRGLVDEASLSASTRRDLFPYFAFGLPPREQMIAYPVAGRGNRIDEGYRRYNFVWYRPADEHTVLRDMVTDETGKMWSEGIPPPLIRPRFLDEARQAAHEVLAPQFAEVVQKTESLFFQPIFDLESPQLAFGRVALLGDAAFVARPHCGMGVTKAADDAMSMVLALQDGTDVVAALRHYEARRGRMGHDIVEHARALGAYMQAQILAPSQHENAERYRTPDAIMKATAMPMAGT